MWLQTQVRKLKTGNRKNNSVYETFELEERNLQPKLKPLFPDFADMV